MLCPSCNNFRPANNAACPFCHALSPLVGAGLDASHASIHEKSPNTWDNQPLPGSSPAWGMSPSGSSNDWQNPSGQQPFSANRWQEPSGTASQQLPFPQTPPTGTGNLWMQVMSPAGEQQPGQGMLPVPYQPQPSSDAMMMLPMGFPTIGSGMQGANPLLPALPDANNAPVYVAPMYTKPRPVIPPYRAVSGMLSIVIVCLLLCTGAGYYAQATGKLVFVQKMFGNWMPPQISSHQNMLPVPGVQLTPGPAWTENNPPITSAAITNDANYNPTVGVVANYVNQFTVNQTIWVVCSASSAAAGKVMVKWYTNGNLYQLDNSKDISANQSKIASFEISYRQPEEGKVEIYWVDAKSQQPVLAVTLLFVVQPGP